MSEIKNQNKKDQEFTIVEQKTTLWDVFIPITQSVGCFVESMSEILNAYAENQRAHNTQIANTKVEVKSSTIGLSPITSFFILLITLVGAGIGC